MLVHRRVTPNIGVASTLLYTWVERGTVGVKCLAQEHNTMSSSLSMRQPRLPSWFVDQLVIHILHLHDHFSILGGTLAFTLLNKGSSGLLAVTILNLGAPSR